MRKVSFYPKLAFSNLWRNKSTYLPYLLACVVSIITFYTLMAINFNPQLAQLRGGEIVVAFTAVGTVIMAIFCAVLIFYTNSFLIKRRKKEIGLYSVLGMQKSNIGALMFCETVFLALLALVAGLVLGALLSHFMYLALMALVRFPVSLAIGISWRGAFYTALYFGGIFLLTLLFNLRQVRIASPLQLLAGAKEGEKEPKASWLLTLFGLIALLAGYGIAIYVQSPIEALMLFLVAVFLVIVGTFCLFTSGSIALLKILRHNKGYYYTPRHFISVSGMIYRMKQNAAGLASICILSCMVLVTVSSTVSLYVGAEDALTSQYPHEFEATATNAEEGGIALQGIQAAAEENGIEIQNMRSVRSYTLTAQRRAEGRYETLTNDNVSFNDVVYFEAIPLEDYNAAEQKNEILQPGEALLFTNKGYNPDVLLQINGLSYKVRLVGEYNGAQAGQGGMLANMLLVLPSTAAVEEFSGAAKGQGGGNTAALSASFQFETQGSPEAKQAFYEQYRAYADETPTAGYLLFQWQQEARQEWYAMHGGFLFLGIYFGVLFLLAAAMIIYYKQISEGYDDSARFDILQKVGMSDEEVKKTIGAQIRTIFFLPLGVAVLHIGVAFVAISRVMLIFGVTNTALLLVSTLVTVLLYALVYIFVYRQTARTYYRLVRRVV